MQIFDCLQLRTRGLQKGALSLMATRLDFPGNFGSEVVKTLEGAFQDVWLLLQAHNSPESDASKDLGIALSRTPHSLPRA